MSSVHPPVSVRLSEPVWTLLDATAKETKRSRSFIIEEALKQHLKVAPTQQNNRDKIERFLSFGKRGREFTPLTQAEIEQRAQDFRGDE
jgi:predicted transcriptional regulator